MTKKPIRQAQGKQNLTASDLAAQRAVETVMAELAKPKQPTTRSRQWQSPKAYKYLVQWSNVVLLRLLLRKVFDDLKSSKRPLSSFKNSFNHPIDIRLLSRTEAQVMDAIRSAIANIEEGWKRATTAEYLQFLSYSQGSLEEVSGDIDRMGQDGWINSIDNSGLASLGIDLKNWSEWCRKTQNATELDDFPIKEVIGSYRKLKDIKGEDITYQILRELINKTDYTIRKLVESLEDKLNKDQKGYQVERARIRGNVGGWR